MKKVACIILCLVVLTGTSTQVFAEYDKDKVIAVMRSNGANMGKLKEAAKNEDFFAAAERLMEIAKNMKSLETITPGKGAKEEWDANHSTLINTAFKGIGACGEENSEHLNKYIDEIGKLIKEGHGMFR